MHLAGLMVIEHQRAILDPHSMRQQMYLKFTHSITWPDVQWHPVSPTEDWDCPLLFLEINNYITEDLISN